jgi:choline dehydrogenase-like flavoprotein
MGSARMAADHRPGVVDDRGMVHSLEGLAVADASLPTSIGVNPQETIIALALRNADRQADALRTARP